MASILGFLHEIPATGEFMAIASGLVWAGAVILYRVSGRAVHPLALNLFKSAFALIVMVPTMLLLGSSFFPAGTPLKSFGVLLLSGFLGIAVSDTFFLYSLNLLGASLLAIVDCFYSPFVIGLSFLLLGEHMTAWQLTGVALIISAVFTAERSAGTAPGTTRVTRRNLALGFLFGVLSMFFIAIGIVIAKPVLASESIVWATFVRLLGGAVPLALFVPALPGRRVRLKPLADPANWKAMVPAALLGSYLSLIFWMGGMKYTTASVSAALNQLNTIFIVIMAAVFLKERLTGWKIVAVILAFVGAYLAAVPL